MRYRSTSSQATYTVYRQQTSRSTCTSSWIPGTATAITGGKWWTKEVWDVEPQPKRLACNGRNGFLPLHPFKVVSTELTDSPGHVPHDSYQVAAPGCLLVTYPQDWAMGSTSWRVSPPAPSQAVLDAVSLGAAAKAKASTYDFLTDLAELSKTAEFIGQSVEGLLRSMSTTLTSDTARLLKKHKGNFLAAFGSAWLEYQFGLKPILYSINDAMHAYVESTDKYTDIMIGKDGQQQTLSATSTSYISNSPANVVISTQQLSGKRTYRSTWYAQLTNPFFRSAGFDPVRSTWEIIPFSWLLDYFLSIGSWLEAMSPYAAGSLVNGCTSVKDEYTLTDQFTFDFNGTVSGIRSTGGGTSVRTLKVLSYERFLANGVPLPGWSAQVSTTRAFNIAALVAQLLTGLGGLRRAWRYRNVPTD